MLQDHLQVSHVYLFVRKDLSAAQICVQVSHAAYEAASLRSDGANHPHFVLIGLRNERELERALNRTQSSGIQVRPFYEADRGNELTAFATQPVLEHQRSFFRRYNCLNDQSFSNSSVPDIKRLDTHYL